MPPAIPGVGKVVFGSDVSPTAPDVDKVELTAGVTLSPSGADKVMLGVDVSLTSPKVDKLVPDAGVPPSRVI